MSVQGLLAETFYVFSIILKALLFARVLLSWFPKLRGRGGVVGMVINGVYTLTDPVLNPIGRMLRRSPLGGISTVVDFSPIFSYFLVDAAVALIIQIIYAF